MLRTLFRLKRRLLFNTYVRGTLQVKLGIVILSVMGLGVGFGSYSLGKTVFASLLTRLGETAAGMLISVVLTSLLLFLTIYGLMVAFYNMFSSPDLNILLVSPIPLRMVFIIKFIDNFRGVATTFLIFLFPALIGFGQAMQAGIGYYPVLVFSILGYLFIPTSLGMLLVVLLIRCFPVEKAKEVFTALSAVVSVLIYGFSQIMLPQLKSANAGADLLKRLGRLEIPYSPGNWVAKVLVASGKGEYARTVVPGLMLAGVALGLLIGCLLLVEKVYLSGWTAGGSVPGRKQKGRVRSRKTHEGLLPGPLARLVNGAFAWVAPRPVRAIIKKDLKSISRDLGELVQMLIPMAFLVIIIMRARSEGNGIPVSAEVGNFAGLGVAGLLVLVMSMFGSRFSLASLGRERQCIWILHSSPVTRLRILWAKVLVAYLPSIVLSLGLFLIAARLLHLSGIAVLAAVLGLLATTLGVAAIGVTIGSIFPKFDAANAKQVIRNSGGILYLVCVIVYLGISAAVFGLAQLLSLLIVGQLTALGISLLALWLLAAGTVAASLAFAASRFEKLEITI